MAESATVIDDLIKKENYALELWEPRGLNPSPPEVISSLEITTNRFLESLKRIHAQSSLSEEEKRVKVQALVDDLPWLDYDTEEKEFLADTIAPAIEFVGFNPWSII